MVPQGEPDEGRDPSHLKDAFPKIAFYTQRVPKDKVIVSVEGGRT